VDITNYEEYLLKVKQELDLMNEEADILLSQEQAKVSLERENIAKLMNEKKYHESIINLIRDDIKDRHDNLMSIIKRVTPKSNPYIKYFYIAALFILLLTAISFAKRYIL
jgi:hypothetical protein